MFAFSSLDVNLGLMVSSALHDLGKEGQAARVDSLNFKARLEFVEDYVQTAAEVLPEAAEEIKAWVAQADIARSQRNQLVHGRWVIDPQKRKAINIVGVPSDDTQKAIEYTIEELEAVGEEFRRLNDSLSLARQRWHLP